MRVIITGRHYNVSTGLKNTIEKKLQKIKFFYDHVLQFQVIVEKEKNGFKVEIAFNADGKRFYLQERSAALTEAVDNLIDKLERQVRKHKERIQNHKGMKRELLEGTRASVLDQVEQFEPDRTPRDELEMVQQLALSERDYDAFFRSPTSNSCVLILREEENYFTLLERSEEGNKWVQKRIYFEGDSVANTDMEDYAFVTCTLEDAMHKMQQEKAPFFLFRNKADNMYQALAGNESGTINLITLGS